jgi:hypothetical protein
MRKIIVGTIVVAFSAIATAGPALAQPTEDRNRSTVGYCMSEILYGNEPNLDAEGNVVPSQSPGPWVNVPTDPDNPVRGRSAGQFNQEGVNIPALCRTAFGSGSD